MTHKDAFDRGYNQANKEWKSKVEKARITLEYKSNLSLSSSAQQIGKITNQKIREGWVKGYLRALAEMQEELLSEQKGEKT